MEAKTENNFNNNDHPGLARLSCFSTFFARSDGPNHQLSRNTGARACPDAATQEAAAYGDQPPTKQQAWLGKVIG